ncbi:MAG: sialate O-acetylesterase [Parcubacteria group bacterium]|jgi:hypothetical protein
MRLFHGVVFVILMCLPVASNAGQHLFIMDGQSNMFNVKPEIIFTPAMKAYYGDDNVVVVHNAGIGRAIRYWDEGGEMWLILTNKITTAVRGKTIDSVTFIFYQGEQDACEPNPASYESKLQSLFERMQSLFPNVRMNYVVTRLNDYNANEFIQALGQVTIRRIQEKICLNKGNYRMVDTDDLNGFANILHNYDYETLQKRYVDAVISMNPKRVEMPGVMYLLRKKRN